MLLRPSGCKVLRRRIQLSSWVSRINVMLSNELFSICSMIVNFAWMEKSWCAKRKCCSTGSNLSEAVDFILCF